MSNLILTTVTGYFQTFNEFFYQRIQSVKYNAATPIIGASRGTSSEKLYQELGLESLRSRRRLRKLCLSFKMHKNKSPSYLCNLIPHRVKTYSTRSSQIDNISNIKTFFSFYYNWIEQNRPWYLKQRFFECL